MYQAPKSPSTRLWRETDLYKKPIMYKPLFFFLYLVLKIFTGRGLHKIQHSSLFVLVLLPVLVFLIHCPVKWLYWPRLFKRWIALSTRLIIIQRISIRETNCTIHWIEIYPVDSVYPAFGQPRPGLRSKKRTHWFLQKSCVRHLKPALFVFIGCEKNA